MNSSDLELLLIRTYRFYSYPIYYTLDSFNANIFQCRYTPSCSQYAEDAIKNHGPVKGVFMAAKRVASCHPPNGGHDPVE